MMDAELASCRILKLLKQYGGMNGSRHKQWLFNQIMQEIEAWQDAKAEIIDKSVCLEPIDYSAMEELEQPGDLTCLCRGCKKEFYVRFDAETFNKLPPQTVNLEIRYCLSGGIYAISVECPHCKHDHYW